MDRQQEKWAVALWVEKNHGFDGHSYIAEQIERLEGQGDQAGVKMWSAVQDCFAQLMQGPIPIHGEPETTVN